MPNFLKKKNISRDPFYGVQIRKNGPWHAFEVPRKGATNHQPPIIMIMGFGEFHKFLILVLEIPQMEIKPETEICNQIRLWNFFAISGLNH
jgi:hypothetical protein